MPKFFLVVLTLATLVIVPVLSQIHPEGIRVNPWASEVYTLRNLSMGEMQFSDSRFYNLYDHGGSPLGILESAGERLNLSAGILRSSRASAGDTLKISHQDFLIPQLSFNHSGIFAAIIYFNRTNEGYQSQVGDSVETGKTRFGLDLAAGPPSGVLRFGLGLHASLGTMEYPGEAERMLLEIPSLRFDIGSRVHPAVEVAAFFDFSARFDSLKSPAARFERVAEFRLPSYGFLVDFGGWESLPLQGNIALELGTERFFGEYRQGVPAGMEYPIIWTGYWELHSQWIYPTLVNDFRLEPAIRFALRSEDAQGYAGIQGNQNPLEKGEKLDELSWEHGVVTIGLGGRAGYRDLATLAWEWETSGHDFILDTTIDRRYSRLGLGIESPVERFAALRIPEGMGLALRAGWNWRQLQSDRPGYRPSHFDPFLPTSQVPSRLGVSNPQPGKPTGYSSFTLGFGLGLWEQRAVLDAHLGFPGKAEILGTDRTEEVSGLEFGIRTTFRI